MASIEYPEICVAIFSFLVTCYLTRHGIPWNWPFIGMLPSILVHFQQIHERCVNLSHLVGYTFLFKGPWFTNMDILLTLDPSNVQHVMISNFTNYPKGDDFLRIFDILGHGIFNSDGDLWKFHRKITSSLITHTTFLRFLVKVTAQKVEKGLVPILQHGYNKDVILDLQDVFQRLTFDTTCLLVSGHDPGCLSLDFPDVPFSKALDEAEVAIAYRHAFPQSLLKLMKWLGLGHEKKLSEAWKILDHFIYNIISKKCEQVRDGKSDLKVGGEDGVDLLTSFLEDQVETKCIMNTKDKKFLRDTILNLMIAGRDTTSSALTWFIWLITQNPQVEEKIRNEVRGIEGMNNWNGWHVFRVEETKKLRYLEAAICECLRLYPPVPLQHKSAMKADTLPSGDKVRAKMKIVISLYGMGRMKGIWGEDCDEFKPERWINEKGKMKYEACYKFMSFNAGPRTCLGKQVALTQIKMVAATLIHNYKFHVMDGHKVEPDVSVILNMKNGLKVKVTNRWESRSC